LETRAAPPDRLEATYGDPVVDGMFADLVRHVRPDVVHVQHTIGLSIGVLATARSLGVPVVMTLHDLLVPLSARPAHDAAPSSVHEGAAVALRDLHRRQARGAICAIG
jgi:hypothetical protein